MISVMICISLISPELSFKYLLPIFHLQIAPLLNLQYSIGVHIVSMLPVRALPVPYKLFCFQ